MCFFETWTTDIDIDIDAPLLLMWTCMRWVELSVFWEWEGKRWVCWTCSIVLCPFTTERKDKLYPYTTDRRYILNPYTAERTDVLENTFPENQEISDWSRVQYFVQGPSGTKSPPEWNLEDQHVRMCAWYLPNGVYQEMLSQGQHFLS